LTIGYLCDAFNKYCIVNIHFLMGGTAMEIIRKIFKLGLFPVLLAFIITTVMPGFKTEARADKGAAFIGGLLAGHIVSGAVQRSKVRTAAAVNQSYGQPRSQATSVQQAPAHAQPAPAPKMTTKQRLDQLDKLAAGGYISPEEYKAKKKGILDSL